MRAAILLAVVGALAACQPLTPEQAEAMRAYAVFRAQQQATQPVYRPAYQQPMRIPTQTYCNRVGNQVSCTTY